MDSSGQVTRLQLSEQMEARRPVSAWLMSLLVHAGLFVVLTLSLQMVPRGALVEPGRSVGIVLVHQQQGEREYIDPHADDAAQDQPSPAALSAALPTAAEIPSDPTEILPGPEQLTGASLAESILEATQLQGDGAPRPGGIEGGTSTEVFGVTGVGSKFVYVFDRSGSMDGYGGRPLQAAKLELSRSLDDLQSIHQFQIIFYNEKPKIFQPLGSTPQLVWGDDEGKRAARKFVQSIVASGGTQHLDALRLALGMKPDAVFFLTDADEPQLTSAELARVRRWNRGSSIHAIEFGFGPRTVRDNFLMRLARQNNGQHAYVDISRLRDLP